MYIVDPAIISNIPKHNITSITVMSVTIILPFIVSQRKSITLEPAVCIHVYIIFPDIIGITQYD